MPSLSHNILLHLPHPKSKAANGLVEQIAKTLVEVCAKLQESNTRYWVAINEHRQAKLFNLRDLVMIYLNKHQNSEGSYFSYMLAGMVLFEILSKINDNACIIDIFTEWNLSMTFNVADIFECFP